MRPGRGQQGARCAQEWRACCALRVPGSDGHTGRAVSRGACRTHVGGVAGLPQVRLMRHDEGGHPQPPLAVKVGLQALRRRAGGGGEGRCEVRGECKERCGETRMAERWSNNAGTIAPAPRSCRPCPLGWCGGPCRGAGSR